MMIKSEVTAEVVRMLRAYAVALSSLLSGAAAVHAVYQPDLVRWGGAARLRGRRRRTWQRGRGCPSRRARTLRAALLRRGCARRGGADVCGAIPLPRGGVRRRALQGARGVARKTTLAPFSPATRAKGCPWRVPCTGRRAQTCSQRERCDIKRLIMAPLQRRGGARGPTRRGSRDPSQKRARFLVFFAVPRGAPARVGNVLREKSRGWSCADETY